MIAAYRAGNESGPMNASHERKPELVALDRATHSSERSADAEERQHPNEHQCGGDHLPDHAEHGQEDDHVVGHTRNLKP